MKRLITILSFGFILFFFSERVFWSFFRPGDNPVDLLLAFIAYSVLAFIVLFAIRKFNVNSYWAVFIVGALYGWLDEGIIAQTLYGSPEAFFPLSLVWTGIAWHALISVSGLYLIQKSLQKSSISLILTSAIIGIFWGFWASFWALDDPAIDASIPMFAIHSILFSLIFILALYLFNKNIKDYKPTFYGLIIAPILLLAWFAVFTLPVQPISLIVLPILLIFSYIILRVNKNKNQSSFLETEKRAGNYLSLLLMPLSAIITFAILNPFPSNTIVFWLSIILGTIIFLFSIFKVLKAR